MRRLVFAVAMSLAMTAGALSVTGFTFLFDQVTFSSYDQFRDEDGNIPAALWDRYLTQAVESYVLGAALGLLVALGLGFILLGVWLRGIERRHRSGGNGSGGTAF
jgi:hypothetical protein